MPQPPGGGGDPEPLPGRRSSPSRSCREGLRPASSRGCTSPSDAIDPWIDEAASRELCGQARLPGRSGHDRRRPLAHLADVVLAGATFAEKAGCYVNADGRLQYAEAALPPRDGALPDLDLFAILLHRPRRTGPLGRGPGRAGRGGSGVRRRPGREAARLSGALLGSAAAADGAARAVAFTDSGTCPRAARSRRARMRYPDGKMMCR